EYRATLFDSKVKSGKSISIDASKEVAIGKGLAKKLRAQIGDEFIILSQAADGSFANDLYDIIGIVESGDEMGDRINAYMHIADAQELFVLEGKAHEIVIMVEDIKRVDRIVGDIESKLAKPSLEVLPWRKVNEAFYNAMQADRQGNDVVYITIMIIVAIGVLNTVLMSVLERTREFGVLKAIGTRPGQVFRLIITEVFFMSIIGVSIGQILGLTANYILSIRGIKLNFQIDVAGIPFDTMRGEINLKSILVPTFIVLFSSIIVSFFPAIKAARTVPAKAMRFH
ncbi:ABC transporter permease, partial [bacterium]|nr:ABC transporter permease [bacterium]